MLNTSDKKACIDELLRRALLLDLEVGLNGRILKTGALLGSETFFRLGGNDSRSSLSALAEFGSAAEVLVGHNLVDYDLIVLREQMPESTLLQLPVIDTLKLSPICFPQNPYHRLVKDYKLLRESVNDPVADAKLCGVLFRDEYLALEKMRDSEPALFSLLHFLLAEPEQENDHEAAGFERLFQALGSERSTQEQALEFCHELLPRWGCANFRISTSTLQTKSQRMALAYMVAWLPVAGATSVLPPWVRARHPLTLEFIRQLREAPCRDSACSYCSEYHDARKVLLKFFGFTDFREDPKVPGESLQRKIVEAGMRNEPLLAILPTGGGKSICFQLPALVRNFRRGSLTIVISPLQALMKDQVDGLTRRTATPFAAALYGMLTPPERGDVLRRIRMGDIAILYVSPEQLRNRSFCDAIAQREIGCWVFDEAHCFSKWGHDFRSDYLYAGRFIRELSRTGSHPIPPIACFTATAKVDVKEEILDFFKTEVGQDLAVFEGGVERANLRFEVLRVSAPEKLELVHSLLEEQFSVKSSGSAIVFRSKRKLTEESAEFLRAKRWRVAHFHAGLTPSQKKEIQDAFLAGDTQVICATNAFGMGIDKEDVRLVIHADTPGSLENYLQEAGRAGRDQKLGRCILLYDEQDSEWQFRTAALSELTRRDIGQILRTLRKARRGQDEVVITAGEILRDEEFGGSIDIEGNDADTKVRTGISWLERAGFIQRDENVTSVFQARPLVRDLAEAEAKMSGLNLSQTEKDLWNAILRTMMNAAPTDALSVDQLAALPEFVRYGAPTKPNSAGSPHLNRGHDHVSRKILRILKDMAQRDLLKRDTLLNAFVHYKIANHSGIRLERTLAADRKLVDLLALAASDSTSESTADWMTLSLPLLNQKLADEQMETSPEFVRQLLRSLSEDGRGFAASKGSIDIRYGSRDTYRVKVNRSWREVSELAEKRRCLAQLVLDTLLAKIPPETEARSDILVDFSFEELSKALDADLFLREAIKDVDSAIERALMFLHEQRVITLRQGLAVFRSAMTIRFREEAERQQYRSSDYQPLEHFYKERKFQVHIMGEYARRAIVQVQDALRLVVAYFTLSKDDFIRRYFSTKKEFLDYATSAESFKRIVTDLANQSQSRIVTAPANRNMLILAGPGSGKSKVVVHRCAWLLRVKRVRPESVLVCCFNRQAAIELRRRLNDLVGDDARGVVVATYHSLAMRLLGRSFLGAKSLENTGELNELIPQATRLLRGEIVPMGLEADEVRDRLLAGFEHILVDEYQDIDAEQYELISAIAGRTMDDADLKLSILAVGDDDQNIYTFRGANIQFIRRFKDDYDAETHYLVENYRSTSYLIAAANQLIEANRDRMKGDHPIRINTGRTWQPPGGEFGSRDSATNGKVQIVQVANIEDQAAAVLEELQRLRTLGVSDWSKVAVLARSHRDLAAVRTVAEQAGIPVRWWADRKEIPPLSQIREIRQCIQWLRSLGSSPVRASDLIAHYSALLFRLAPDGERDRVRGAPNPWITFVFTSLEAWKTESMDAELPAFEALEFLISISVESRGDISYGEGVILGTIHAAKGTEHDHVLLTGSWPVRGAREADGSDEEARRLLYVGMTRARHTLTLFDCRPSHTSRASLVDTISGPDIIRRSYKPKDSLTSSGARHLNYTLLGLENINLGFPGLYPEHHPIHTALSELQPGAPVTLVADGPGVAITNSVGLKISRLSRTAAQIWASRLSTITHARVVALVHRTAEHDTSTERKSPTRYSVSEWEIPIIELIHST